jgi:hypothetical protein
VRKTSNLILKPKSDIQIKEFKTKPLTPTKEYSGIRNLKHIREAEKEQ